MHENLDPYQVHTLERLFFKIPLGFSAIHEVQGVDLRSKATNLKKYVDIQEYSDLILYVQ